MTIIEATKKAMKEDKVITDDKTMPTVMLKPTDTDKGYIIMVMDGTVASIKWNPDMKDLMSTDWYVTEVKENEHQRSNN